MTTQSINPHGVPFAEDALSEADVIASPCVDASIDTESRFVELDEMSDNHLASPSVSTTANIQG